MNAKYLESDAVISECGKYRYLLRRTWDHARPRALFIMLNPSTADATVDDATIRSCVRLAKSWRYGSFEVVNLFALRATDPKDLLTASDPFGPQNERAIIAAINRCDMVICAWGAHQLAAKHCSYFLLGHITSRHPRAWCLGKTKSGAPRHPLYVKSGTPLEVYR